MTRIDHVAVVVPAADEQDALPACLAALDQAVAALAVTHPRVTTDVVVVLDACQDASADIVAAAPGCHAVVTAARSVGRAREAGSCAALVRAPVSSDRVWIAHTDADSAVPAHWLSTHLNSARSGAALVLGTVLPDLPQPALRGWQSVHDDVDEHPHIHGANLGVRGDVLARLGGWPALRTGEDVALVARATSSGVRVDRVGGMAVRTSARCAGRAPLGFSSYLRTTLAHRGALDAVGAVEGGPMECAPCGTT